MKVVEEGGEDGGGGGVQAEVGSKGWRGAGGTVCWATGGSLKGPSFEVEKSVWWILISDLILWPGSVLFNKFHWARPKGCSPLISLNGL